MPVFTSCHKFQKLYTKENQHFGLYAYVSLNISQVVCIQICNTPLIFHSCFIIKVLFCRLTVFNKEHAVKWVLKTEIKKIAGRANT